jgi:hypothetical protein
MILADTFADVREYICEQLRVTSCMDPVEADARIRASRYSKDYYLSHDNIRNLRVKHIDCQSLKATRDVDSVAISVRPPRCHNLFTCTGY